MIEKMKKIMIVSPSARKKELLDGIRNLGVVHITEKAAPDAAMSERLASLNRIRGMLAEKAGKEKPAFDAVLTGAAFEALHESLVSEADERRVLSDSVVRLGMVRESIAKWGDFDPAQIRELESAGFAFTFWLIGSRELAALPEEVKYIRLSDIDRQNAIAVLGELPPGCGGTRFVLPEKGVSALDAEIAASAARIKEIDGHFASSVPQLASYDKAIVRLTDEIIYNSVSEGAVSEEGLTVISGFIPEADLPAFREKAGAKCWAYALDDPAEEDPVPTKVRYNKVTKMMKPLFDMLGTVPGYREYDISMWFLLFLALFF